MTSPPRRILLGIGGGIAAYKAADLCSGLSQAGHQVQVVMTKASTQFIGPSTLAALSGRPVAIDSFDLHHPLGAHIELARETDLFVVAPATANVLAKFAAGVADDLLSTLYLQNVAPVLLAPAMSDPMWNHPSVTRNVQTLLSDGCHLVGPEKGWLSCRVQGTGRLSEPAKIQEQIDRLLGNESR